MAFHPYLNFGGNCREAFTRYQEIFGGELVLMPMSEMPPGDFEVPADQKDMIMHAALMFEGHILMASDAPGPDFGPVQYMYVNYTTPDIAGAQRVFDALAEDGKVEMPFGEQFWTPGFGVCVDRFGTPWMVNVESPVEG